jgi:deoxyadenosine/deoxycytidine kinase
MITSKFGNFAIQVQIYFACTDFVNNSNITAALHLVFADRDVFEHTIIKTGASSTYS